MARPALHRISVHPTQLVSASSAALLIEEVGAPISRSVGRPPLSDLADLLRERSKTLAEMAAWALASSRSCDEIEIDAKGRQEAPEGGERSRCSKELRDAPRRDRSRAGTNGERSIENAFEAVREASRGTSKMGKLAQPVRVSHHRPRRLAGDLRDGGLAVTGSARRASQPHRKCVGAVHLARRRVPSRDGAAGPG